VPKQSATRALVEAVPEATPRDSTRRPPAGARLRKLAAESWQGWTLGFALNGFFVYLAGLDAIDVHPRTAFTGAWYALVGAICLAAAWPNRELLQRRLEARATSVRVYVVSAALLALWFVANVLLVARSTAGLKFAALLVLWSLPAAILAASAPPRQLRNAAWAIVVLGGFYVSIEAVALARTPEVQRFTPIASLDPISAGLIAGLAAVSLLALDPRRPRYRVLQTLALVVFVTGATVPGSRGPVIATVGGCIAGALVAWRRLLPVTVVALALGLGIGVVLARDVGTEAYLTQSVPGLEPQAPAPSQPASDQSVAPEEPEPISTLNMRRAWFHAALAQAPDRPIFGHGVAQLVDNTPEAHRMGVAGEHIYPHNTFAEAAFSLGLLGLVPYVALVLTAFWAFVGLVRRQSEYAVLAAAVGGFAFFATNVSGEIGTDAVLWVASAMLVTLYADQIAARVRGPVSTTAAGSGRS